MSFLGVAMVMVIMYLVQAPSAYDGGGEVPRHAPQRRSHLMTPQGREPMSENLIFSTRTERCRNRGC